MPLTRRNKNRIPWRQLSKINSLLTILQYDYYCIVVGQMPAYFTSMNKRGISDLGNIPIGKLLFNVLCGIICNEQLCFFK